MNNIGVFKDHDYMDDSNSHIKGLYSTIKSLDKEVSVLSTKLGLYEDSVNSMSNELDKLHSLWFNRLYVFITTLRVRKPFLLLRLRSPFYNQS